MNHKIIPLVPVSSKGLNERAQALLDMKFDETPPQGEIISSKDFWQINGVNYRNKVYPYHLLKSLLDSGNKKTQDDWVSYSEQSRKSNGFYVGDMPLYHAIFTAVYKQRNNPKSEEIRKFIQESMRERYLMTLTRILYQPSGKDKIIHNYHTSSQYELEEKILGPNRKIEQSDSLALKALLGTDDLNEISEVYNWINQTSTWLWRINNKPSNVDERTARFDAVSDRVNLYCYGNPVDLDHSFGVRLAQKK